MDVGGGFGWRFRFRRGRAPPFPGSGFRFRGLGHWGARLPRRGVSLSWFTRGARRGPRVLRTRRLPRPRVDRAGRGCGPCRWGGGLWTSPGRICVLREPEGSSPRRGFRILSRGPDLRAGGKPSRGVFRSHGRGGCWHHNYAGGVKGISGGPFLKGRDRVRGTWAAGPRGHGNRASTPRVPPLRVAEEGDVVRDGVQVLVPILPLLGGQGDRGNAPQPRQHAGERGNHAGGVYEHHEFRDILPNLTCPNQKAAGGRRGGERKRGREEGSSYQKDPKVSATHKQNQILRPGTMQRRGEEDFPAALPRVQPEALAPNRPSGTAGLLPTRGLPRSMNSLN